MKVGIPIQLGNDHNKCANTTSGNTLPIKFCSMHPIKEKGDKYMNCLFTKSMQDMQQKTTTVLYLPTVRLLFLCHFTVLNEHVIEAQR